LIRHLQTGHPSIHHSTTLTPFSSTTIHPIVATKVPFLEPLEDRQLDPRQWTHEEDLPPVFLQKNMAPKNQHPGNMADQNQLPEIPGRCQAGYETFISEGYSTLAPMIVEADNSSSKVPSFFNLQPLLFESVSFLGM